MSSGLPALFSGKAFDKSGFGFARSHAPRSFLDALGLDEARRDRVHRDVVRPELERERLGEADDAALGRRVVHADAVAAAARGDRGEVDDAAELARLHARRELAAHEERGGEVRRDDRAPLLIAQVFEQQRALRQLAAACSSRVGATGPPATLTRKSDRADAARELLHVVRVSEIGHDKPRRNGWISVPSASTPSCSGAAAPRGRCRSPRR